VTDTIRAIDYLQTRPDVDPERIGMMGISMGGMNTWLTAAADPRVKVAVPCIG
jgi:dienelactone hydrolase